MVLSPLFFVLFFIEKWTGWGAVLSVVGCWIVFFLIELSDLLDGYLARRLNQNSEWGKVLDPFADSLSRLTYFACFAGAGIMPLWIFLLLLYRDLGVAYIRIFTSRSGAVMGARLSGKVKAWVYAAGGVAGMARRSSVLLGIENRVILSVGIYTVFGLCAAVAVYSLADYYVRSRRQQ